MVINLNFGVVLEEIKPTEQTNIYKDYKILNKGVGNEQ
jgi:hypothetical protein